MARSRCPRSSRPRAKRLRLLGRALESLLGLGLGLELVGLPGRHRRGGRQLGRARALRGGRVLDQAARDQRVDGPHQLRARVRHRQQLADSRAPRAERERRPFRRRRLDLLVVERRRRDAAQPAQRVAERALEPVRVREEPHPEQQQPIRVELERLVGRDRAVHRVAPQRAARPAQDRQHDPLHLRRERAGELAGAQDAGLHEHVAEREAGGLHLAHRRAELRLAQPAGAEQARPEPVLLDRRGREDDVALEEVDALRHLALAHRQDSRPALVARARDLVGDQHA